MRFLLDRGAEINASNNVGTTSLHVAIEQGNLAIARELVGFRANISAIDNNGNIPLHIACRSVHPNLQVIRFLVDQGPGATSSRNNSGELPLHLACRVQASSLEVVEYLVEQHAAGLTIQGLFGFEGFLPFHRLATSNPTRDVIESLLRLRPNHLTARTLDGRYPVMVAASTATAPLGVVYDLLRMNPAILHGE